MLDPFPHVSRLVFAALTELSHTIVKCLQACGIERDSRCTLDDGVQQSLHAANERRTTIGGNDVSQVSV